MKFKKIIANISSDQVDNCQEVVTSLTLDVCLNPLNRYCGSKLGGNTFNSMKLLTSDHILVEDPIGVGNDGNNYYWEHSFVTSKSISKYLRLPYTQTMPNEIKRNYDDEKLASYIVNSVCPVDLESFEKEYPEFVERVNKIFGY